MIRLLLFLALVTSAHASATEGKVLEDHSGRALASAEVRVTPANGSELVADLETESDGSFNLPDLPPAVYRIEVSKPNYLPVTLEVRMGNGASGLLVARLIRCGVISGRVLDAQGQPVRSATVFALSRQSDAGPLRPFARSEHGHQARVDENGEYRLFNLPPGQFAIAVTYGASTVMVGSTGDTQAGPAGSGVLYYPVGSPTRLFTVAGGEEYQDVDFSLVPDALFRVSGKIDLAAPQSDYWLALTSQSQSAFASAITKANDDGTFRFEGIPPGSYSLFAEGPSHGRGSLGISVDEHSLFGRLPVEVSGDVDGLAIAVQKGRSASFVLRNAVPGERSCSSSLEIRILSLEDWGADLDRTVTADFGKPARLQNLAPARYLLAAQNPDAACFVAGDTFLDLTTKVDSGPVAIPVTTKGSIHGRLAADKQQLTNWVIVLAPASASGNDLPVKVAFADSEARFTFDRLRPGRYRIAAHATNAVSQRWLPDLSGAKEIDVKPVSLLMWSSIMNRLVILLVAIPVAAQTNPPKGSISGTVLDGLSGSPLAAADIYVKPGNKSVTTDDKGHYEIKDLDSATYHLSVYTKSRAHGAKEVHLATGQDLTVDFRIAPKASISGRVVDENGEPKPGITLLLVAREYRLGTLRYVFAESAETDDRGRYTISNIEPGSGYLLEAARRMQRFSPVSDAPADPKLRRKTTIPTWYPDSDSMDAAQVMVLQPGEHREGIDIALKKSVSYCIDGILATDKGPGPLNFSIEEREPSSGQSGDGAFFMSPPYSEAGADGRIRVCDLHPGVYRLTAFDSGDNGPTFFGETEVPVGDKDVHGVKAFGRGRISVSGELVWDGKPPDQSLPDQSSPAKVHIWLQPMTRAPFSGELSSTNNLPPQPVPAQFKLPDLLTDDYSVRVLNIPAGAYLKDIVYGGQSALREPMHVGKTMGSDLRVVLAHDGGVIKVKVADKDSNPVPDCKVVLLPESASTESEVADSMLQGQSDQFGVYTSSSLAPGKYFVLATNASVDRTPESIGKLMRARIHAHETELPPNGSIAVTIMPMDLN